MNAANWANRDTELTVTAILNEHRGQLKNNVQSVCDCNPVCICSREQQVKNVAAMLTSLYVGEQADYLSDWREFFEIMGVDHLVVNWDQIAIHLLDKFGTD